MRGADLDLGRDTYRVEGPSPRVRGRRLGSVRRHRSSRTIPGYAGPTPTSTNLCGDRRDHPGVRGADLMPPTASGHAIGPSPRAGPTARPRRAAAQLQEHSRARGRQGAVRDRRSDGGLFPRARDDKARASISSHAREQSPRAGPTPTRPLPSSAYPDHPLARGRRVRRETFLAWARTIPARGGRHLLTCTDSGKCHRFHSVGFDGSFLGGVDSTTLFDLYRLRPAGSAATGREACNPPMRYWCSCSTPWW